MFYLYDNSSRLVTFKDNPTTHLVRHGLDKAGRVTKVSQDDIDGCCGTDPLWTRINGPYLIDQILWGEYDIDANKSTGSDKFYFHLDYLGTLVMLTQDTTNPPIAESYRYDEYGEPYVYDGDGNYITISAYEQDKLYTGRR
jgi:hypothetical protein